MFLFRLRFSTALLAVPFFSIFSGSFFPAADDGRRMPAPGKINFRFALLFPGIRRILLDATQ